MMFPALYAPAETINSLSPRPYQAEAIEALHAHICAHDSNPCVVIPTGGGKSLLIAWVIQRWKAAHPPFRVCILAHRKELIQQNAEEMAVCWPGADIGVYSAGLRQRDEDASILFASIDSVYSRAGIFPPFDCLIIDEAHRIPAKGEGKYRQFIAECRIQNKNLRVIGFTATPFRLGCGPICHKDHILHEICYEANIAELIRDGYLCNLRTRIGDKQPDLDQVKRRSGGDYITASLAEATNSPDVVQAAIASAVKAIRAEERHSIIFFCVNVAHCHAVSRELRRYAIDAPVVTAKTPASVRDAIAARFKAGRLSAICNVNVYTEGFNAKQVDCIVLLRPTLSPSLYIQMVGRGLRLHPQKEDCLVLDYGQCIATHGPIDNLGAGMVRLIECQDCGDIFSRAVGQCPHCQWEIPKAEVERAAAEEERQRQMHDTKASKLNIIGSNVPETLAVESVSVQRHAKPGAAYSLKVTYYCGCGAYSEWICLDHGGFAEHKARHWWKARGLPNWDTVTVEQALGDMFLPQWIAKKTKTITVQKDGKFWRIIRHGLNYDTHNDA